MSRKFYFCKRMYSGFELYLDGQRYQFHSDTKRHKLVIYKMGALDGPFLIGEFSKAKGEAILNALQLIEDSFVLPGKSKIPSNASSKKRRGDKK